MAFDERAVDDAHPHVWKRVRTSVTLLVLIGVVVGAAWYSWRNVVGSDDEPTATPTGTACAPGAPTAAPAPTDIRVNVYNATGRTGLAASIAREVRQRGFVVLEVDNDPLSKTIKGTAEVRSHPDQQAAAGLVASLVPGAVYVADKRAEPSVDLVLGDAFEALAEPGAPAPPPPTGLPTCTPVG